jgi:hypothetical protein
VREKALASGLHRQRKTKRSEESTGRREKDGIGKKEMKSEEGGGRMNLSGKGIGNTGDEKTGVERGIVGRSEITGMDGAGAVVTTLI